MEGVGPAHLQRPHAPGHTADLYKPTLRIQLGEICTERVVHIRLIRLPFCMSARIYEAVL